MMKTMLVIAAALATAMSAAPAAAAIVDGSFETQGASVGNGFCYFAGNYGPACSTGAWSGGGTTSGLQFEGNTAWPGASTPAGAYYAFIQSGYGAEGSISQTFTVSGGRYALNWLDAGRPNNGGNQGYTVAIDGTVIYTGATTSSQAFTTRFYDQAFDLSAGSHTVTFQALNSGGDNAAFIDGVSLAAVPEPASWAMMIGGFGMIGGTLRRRSANRRTTVSFA